MDAPSASFRVCSTLIGTMIQSASTARQMIETTGDSTEEFEDALQQFSFIGETLEDLERLFRNSSVPPSLVGDYERRLRIFKTRLDQIERALNQIFQQMYSKSFFRRLQRKSNVVNGDLRRLTNKLLAFNQSLQGLMTTFICQLSCALIGFVHDDASRTELSSTSIAEMSSRTVERSQSVRGAIMSRSSWDWDQLHELESEISGASGTSRELSHELEGDSALPPSTGHHELGADNIWKPSTAAPPGYEETQVASSSADAERYTLGQGLTPLNEETQLEENKSAGANTSSRRRHSYNYNRTSWMRPSTVLAIDMGPDEPRRTDGHVSLQEKYAMDAKRVQDEEWMEWTQARKNVS